MTSRGTVRLNYLRGIAAEDWWRLLRTHRKAVHPGYHHRAAFVTAASLMNTLFRRREEQHYESDVANVRIRQPPVFILGHWRSGTTHLHNLLSQDDEQFTYPNLYQTIHAHTFLSTEEFVTRRFAALAPRRRPQDNMALGFHTPQEDEFALAVTSLCSPYLGMFSFPRHEAHYARYLTFQGVPAVEIERWKTAFVWFLKKLTLKQDRALLLKSPPHTARIRLLLDLFPDARFVHIHRDPYTVFQSTRHLFDTLARHFYMQHPEVERIDDQIIGRYRLLYDAFFEEKSRIPSGHLLELSFEELERDPIGQVRTVYERLGLDGFERLEPKLRRYMDSVSDYRKNRFPELSPTTRSTIAKAWQRSFHQWRYPC